MKSNTLRIITCCLFAIAVFACDKEEKESIEELLTGVWVLTEKTIDGQSVTLSDCEKESTIEFLDNNICILYDGCEETTINSGWNYKYDMLNIAVHLPAAYYVEHIDKSSLEISRYDLASEGELMLTIFSYLKQL